MNRYNLIATLLAGMCVTLATPKPTFANMCFGEHFTVEILIESCTDGPRRDPKYGLITLTVQARTLKVETQPIPEKIRPELLAPFNPSDIAKVNESRTYTLPTGNGYIGPPKVILSCGDVVGRQMRFATSTCNCKTRTCESLFLEPPAEWWPQTPRTNPYPFLQLY